MGKIATDADSLSEGSQGRAIGSGVPIIEADRLMDEIANPLDPAPSRRDRPNSSLAKAMRFRDQFELARLYLVGGANWFWGFLGTTIAILHRGCLYSKQSQARRIGRIKAGSKASPIKALAAKRRTHTFGREQQSARCAPPLRFYSKSSGT